MSETFCVVSFKSIHHVIKAEHTLKSAGIWTDMIPNPRGITSDCGMSIRIKCDEIERIKKELKKGNERDFRVYGKSGDEYIIIS